MKLSPDDRKAVEDAFAQAQARTRAPIVGVMLRAAADYAAAPLLAAAALALLTPWPLIVLTIMSAERIFLIQLVVFLVAYGVASLTPLRIAMTSPRARRAIAHRAGALQFAVRGLDHAGGREGVLIFVSLAERYARVLPGEAAAAGIDSPAWQGLVDALTADVAAKGPREALIAAAGRVADLLAPRFPPGETATSRMPGGFHAN